MAHIDSVAGTIVQNLDHPAAQSVAIASMLPALLHGLPEIILGAPAAIYYLILAVRALRGQDHGAGSGQHHQ